MRALAAEDARPQRAGYEFIAVGTLSHAASDADLSDTEAILERLAV